MAGKNLQAWAGYLAGIVEKGPVSVDGIAPCLLKYARLALVPVEVAVEAASAPLTPPIRPSPSDF
jgi:hypothetical protein